MAEQPPDDRDRAPGDDGEPARDGPDLERVLSALEDILSDRHGVRDDASRTPPPEGDQLPLLKNVVVPGDLLFTAAGEAGPAEPEPAPEALPPHQDLVRRLASELEVIIESCVDEALAAARKDLMAKLSNHLDIVLPELLEELERRRDLPPRRDAAGGDADDERMP